jgi:hypothetical protein
VLDINNTELKTKSIELGIKSAEFDIFYTEFGINNTVYLALKDLPNLSGDQSKSKSMLAANKAGLFQNGSLFGE